MNKTRTVMNSYPIPKSYIKKWLERNFDLHDLNIHWARVNYESWWYKQSHEKDSVSLKLCYSIQGHDRWVREYVRDATEYNNSIKETVYPYLYFIELLRREGTAFDYENVIIRHCIHLLENAGLKTQSIYNMIFYDLSKWFINTSYLRRILDKEFPEFVHSFNEKEDFCYVY